LRGRVFAPLSFERKVRMELVIADHHVVCREALENFIRHTDEKINVRGASDYGGLINILNECEADFILLDTELPGLPTMDDFANIDLSNTKVRVGILVRDMDATIGIDSVGAHGIFPKSLPGKTLLQRMMHILSGESFVPSDHDYSDYDANVSNFGMRKKKDHSHLTQREKEVLSFLVKGATNKDIARALNLQVVTVKLHVRGICRKMEAKNRTQAALLAKEYGWDT
jgi:two-component system nitrate/nitrite response regulator NarL